MNLPTIQTLASVIRGLLDCPDLGCESLEPETVDAMEAAESALLFADESNLEQGSLFDRLAVALDGLRLCPDVNFDELAPETVAARQRADDVMIDVFLESDACG